jgi:hypothetical protein
VTNAYADAVAEAIRLGLMSPNSVATDRCRCPECGEVFTTERNFDRHLALGRLAEDYDGAWCRSPAEIGLVRVDDGWWQAPGPETQPWPSGGVPHAALNPERRVA